MGMPPPRTLRDSVSDRSARDIGLLIEHLLLGAENLSLPRTKVEASAGRTSSFTFLSGTTVVSSPYNQGIASDRHPSLKRDIDARHRGVLRT
jgi:hypothetical protein